MDASLKEKWVSALRSGAYKQYRGGLGSNRFESMCCLGVLWDICGRPKELDRFWDQHLPDNADGTSLKDILIVMNDQEEKSFAEIADYIEKNL